MHLQKSRKAIPRQKRHCHCHWHCPHVSLGVEPSSNRLVPSVPWPGQAAAAHHLELPKICAAASLRHPNRQSCPAFCGPFVCQSLPSIHLPACTLWQPLCPTVDARCRSSKLSQCPSNCMQDTKRSCMLARR